MFRFTIRDVLWLMVVVGLSLGWVIEHRRIGKAPAQLRALISVLNQNDISVEMKPPYVTVISLNPSRFNYSMRIDDPDPWGENDVAEPHP